MARHHRGGSRRHRCVPALVFSYSGPLLGTYNRNGFQLGADASFSVDGLIAVVLGVVTIVIGIARLTGTAMPRFLQRSSIVTGIALVILGASDVASVSNMVQNVKSQSSAVIASVGFGLYIVIFGGVVAIVAGLILRQHVP